MTVCNKANDKNNDSLGRCVETETLFATISISNFWQILLLGNRLLASAFHGQSADEREI